MIVEASDAAIAKAAALLRAGDLVAFPTETVYGLGAIASSDEAVAKVFALKGRPTFNPLIVHLASAKDFALHVDVPPLAEALVAAFVPGPLTLVLKRRAGCRISLLASAGLDSLAIRVPDHPVARALIETTGSPLVAPSANRSGRVSPTTAAHVAADFGAAAPLILDGGPCRHGLESTVIDLTGSVPRLLRPGAIARGAIEALVGPLAAPASGALLSPGLLEGHYAPARPVRLEASAVRPGEALLAFGPAVPEGAVRTLNLSPAGDLVEAAARLFAYLRALDAPPASAIAIMPIPAYGLGEAINDRLRRAGAPRG